MIKVFGKTGPRSRHLKRQIVILKTILLVLFAPVTQAAILNANSASCLANSTQKEGWRLKHFLPLIDSYLNRTAKESLAVERQVHFGVLASNVYKSMFAGRDPILQLNVCVTSGVTQAACIEMWSSLDLNLGKLIEEVGLTENCVSQEQGANLKIENMRPTLQDLRVYYEGLRRRLASSIWHLRESGSASYQAEANQMSRNMRQGLRQRFAEMAKRGGPPSPLNLESGRGDVSSLEERLEKHLARFAPSSSAQLECIDTQHFAQHCGNENPNSLICSWYESWKQFLVARSELEEGPVECGEARSFAKSYLLNSDPLGALQDAKIKDPTGKREQGVVYLAVMNDLYAQSYHLLSEILNPPTTLLLSAGGLDVRAWTYDYIFEISHLATHDPLSYLRNLRDFFQFLSDRDADFSEIAQLFSDYYLIVAEGLLKSPQVGAWLGTSRAMAGAKSDLWRFQGLLRSQVMLPETGYFVNRLSPRITRYMMWPTKEAIKHLESPSTSPSVIAFVSDLKKFLYDLAKSENALNSLEFVRDWMHADTCRMPSGALRDGDESPKIQGELARLCLMSRSQRIPIAPLYLLQSGFTGQVLAGLEDGVEINRELEDIAHSLFARQAYYALQGLEQSVGLGLSGEQLARVERDLAIVSILKEFDITLGEGLSELAGDDQQVDVYTRRLKYLENLALKPSFRERASWAVKFINPYLSSFGGTNEL